MDTEYTILNDHDDFDYVLHAFTLAMIWEGDWDFIALNGANETESEFRERKARYFRRCRAELIGRFGTDGGMWNPDGPNIAATIYDWAGHGGV